MATAGDSPQAPTTPQTSTSRSSAFSALTDQAQPGAEGLDGRGSGREVQPQHSGITPLLPDDSPRTTPPRPDGLPLGPHSIGPRPSMKVPQTCCAAPMQTGCGMSMLLHACMHTLWDSPGCAG